MIRSSTRDRFAGHRVGREPLAHGRLAGQPGAVAERVVRPAAGASPSASAAGSSGSTSSPPPVASINSGNDAVPRLHHRHAVGPRFQHVQPLRLAVRRRHATARRSTAGTAPCRRASGTRRARSRRAARPASSLLHCSSKNGRLFSPSQPDACSFAARRSGICRSCDERLDEVVEALLGADAGEVADRAAGGSVATARGPPWPCRLMPG